VLTCGIYTCCARCTCRFSEFIEWNH
jgi:hypothetical protein